MKRDYEIILDKVSRLSLREDLPADQPIIETITRHYFISDKVIRGKKEIIVS